MVFDTNVLIYASDEHSEFDDRCLQLLRASLVGTRILAWVTWKCLLRVILQVITRYPVFFGHRRVAQEAWRFVESLLTFPRIQFVVAYGPSRDGYWAHLVRVAGCPIATWSTTFIRRC